MKGGLDRLIARVALGRHDVRPLAPTLFERDGSADEPWQGEQAIEMLAEAPHPGLASPSSSAVAGARAAPASATAAPPPTLQIVHEEAAPQPSASPSASPLTAAPRAVPAELPPPRGRRERGDWMELDDAAIARSDPAGRSAVPAPSRTAAPPVAAPSFRPEQQVLVETVEHNSIIIEIGRIEVKAPAAAPPQSPVPAPMQRRGPRLTLDAYLSERRAARR